MLDRIAIHFEVAIVDYEKLSEGVIAGDSSARASCKKYSTATLERSRLGYHLQCRHARWGDKAILQVAGRGSEFDAGDIVLCMSQLNLSACACHSILRLARTIADLAGGKEI
jgi:predicted ATPase with chaperone activity